MARVTPALYHLLPSFEDACAVPDGFPSDLFDSKLWQPSIVKSIAQYIDDWGLPTDDSDQAATQVLQTMLDEARNYRSRVQGLDLKALGLEDDWLAVIGAGEKTRTSLAIELDEEGEPMFRLESSARNNSWTGEGGRAEARRDYETGDGTVPLRGALPKFLDRSKVICVVPDDFGYWEWRDRLLGAVSSFHGLIPNMNMIHRLILRFLLNAEDRHENTWGRRLPDVEEWNPPVSPLRER